MADDIADRTDAMALSSRVYRGDSIAMEKGRIALCIHDRKLAPSNRRVVRNKGVNHLLDAKSLGQEIKSPRSKARIGAVLRQYRTHARLGKRTSATHTDTRRGHRCTDHTRARAHANKGECHQQSQS